MRTHPLLPLTLAVEPAPYAAKAGRPLPHDVDGRLAENLRGKGRQREGVFAYRAVIVDPIDDKARSFYEAHGRLIMPML